MTEKNLPSLPEQLKNLAGDALESAIRVFKRGAVLVPNEIREQRLGFCLACPEMVQFKERKRCSKCGCFVDTKTWVAVSSCPVGKWERYSP